MIAFRDLSIRYKYTLLLLGLVTVVLLVVSVANVISQVQSTRASMAATYTTLARIVAAQSGAALSIADIDASGAQQVVSDLAAEPTIRFAALYDARGIEVARYSADRQEAVPQAPLASRGAKFTSAGYLDVVQDVKLNNGSTVGRVYLRVSTAELYDEIQRTIVIAGSVLIGALGLTVIMSLALQRLISAPILELANLTRRVSSEHDYSLSAEKRGNDELGVLCDGLNSMLHEIRRRDSELQEQHARLERVIESAPNAIVMIDCEGRMVLVNGQAEKYFGYSRGELLGQPVEMLVPERFRGEHPANRSNYFARPETRTMGVGRDLFGRRKDGSEFPVEIGLNPIQFDAGLLVLSSIVDITERKRAEEKFRQAVESAPNGMVMIDQAGRIVLVNAQTESLFGYSRDELLGQPVELLVPDRLRDKHPEYRHNFFAAPVVRSMGVGRDLFGRRKDGSEFPIEIGLNPIHTADGLLVLSAVVDITERKRAEGELRASEERFRLLNQELEQRVTERTSQLAAANKELEAFSYSVSHDLRAPLRAIDGFSRILLQDYLESLAPDIQEYLRDIRANTQRMGQLVDDLLSFSRLGRKPLSTQQIASGELVRQCLEELRPEQEGRNVEVRVGELPACSADRALIKQVWINLLSNALKYTGRRPIAEIEVGSRPSDESDKTTYFVKDNGVGFDMRFSGKLFGVFQRLHRAEDYPGTGVGLAIVQRIISRHGGRIWAESAPDRGATFYFTLANEEATHV